MAVVLVGGMVLAGSQAAHGLLRVSVGKYDGRKHSAEEKEHGQRMVQRVQLHMHEGTLGRYRKGGRGSSQETENVPRSRTGQLVELSTVRTPT